ncbi:divergent polysaccharide deacetylase family protein [Sedimenticola sp.]|uniref:divergent polysaccharide deacetylase family protein n=1 Tax=Sedimenticola sp. TaxID=1940285 RepID=UPI003D0C25BF
MSGGKRHRWVLLLLLMALSMPLWSAGRQPSLVITVIIDDMGNQAGWGEAALTLPGAMTYAFLPHTPHASRLAQQAYATGKEVMLHLPMESHEGNPLGPGALTLHMTEIAFKRTLQDDLNAVPHVRGLNNHMGSLLTRHPGAMAWLMQALRSRNDLFFIDSRTALETVAQQMATEYGVPNANRDVFLDNDRTLEAIDWQFDQLIKRARRQGYAIGIGHPYPETTQVLAQRLPELRSLGIKLIPASEMIEYQRSRTLWHVSSSPSPKVAKSSKP